MSIDFYKENGDLGYLANYSNHGFTVDNVFYPTVEHFYQASKFSDEELRKKIINSKTPKEASNIGRDRKNKRIDNFTKMKLEKMYEGIYNKFSQNKDIRSKLIETKKEYIREMSVKESFWGVGPNLDGKNEIGKILVRVREQVKKDLLEEIINKCKNKKVYIIGHKKPDADSVFSSLILTHILKANGVDAVFAVRDEAFVDDKMIKDYLKEEYVVVDDYTDKEFILVDHNLLDGINKENVIASFDHHRITGDVEDLVEMEYASTGLLLYDVFKDKYNFTEEEKELIALTVLTDTDFLTSSRFFKEDQDLYKELDSKLDSKKMMKKYLKTNIFNLSINENFFKDYKEYDYNHIHINRSMIRSYTKERKEYYDTYVSNMEKHSINLLIWCDYEELVTMVCYNGISLQFPYFTTSTTLVLDYLKKEKHLL